MVASTDCGAVVPQHPADLALRASNETSHHAFHVKGRGRLRAISAKHLRTDRTQGRAHGFVPGTGTVVDIVLLAARPAKVDDVHSHWEGDLVRGRRGQSTIATALERQSRFVMPVRPSNRRLARDALRMVTRTLPVALWLARVGRWQGGGWRTPIEVLTSLLR